MKPNACAKSRLTSRLLVTGIASVVLCSGLTESGQIGPTAARGAAQLELVAGHASGQLQLQIRGQSSCIYQIQASTNLIDWTSIAQIAGSNGTVTFTDTQAARFPRRFYRAVQTDDLAGFSPDRILVKPRPGADLSGLNLSLGVVVLQVFPAVGNLQVVKVPPSTSVSALIDTYGQSGLAQYAEPDYYVHALATPDDFYFTQGNLWHLHNTGQFSGTPNADIQAPAGWDIQHDASNVIVAVVDTGVRYTHEDLAANMWVNPADGSHGTNVVAGNTDPNDDYGHGTHVAGSIGAVGNNNVGVVGVAWRTQIMACKFLDTQGNGTIDGAIACIDYARSHRANIVNASWGATNFTSQALHDAVASLRDAGIMFVAAAGNSGANNDTTPLYPASYSDLDNVIAVAATDRNDLLTSWSDYGPTNVDLAAPGASIYSCWNGSDSDYQSDDGTSMAAALVSGAVAVMEAHFPNENYQQIKQQILANIDPLPTLLGKCVSGGRLDLYKALKSGAPPPPLTASFTANPNSGQAPLLVQFTDTSTGNPTSWNWNFGDGASSTAQNPSHTYNSAGSFTATLTVSGSGQSSSASQMITVTNGSSQSVTANFSANPGSGQAPLTVQFTDQSSGPVSSWNWSFGDGATSTLQNPSHTYDNAGSFTATLAVGGSSGQTSSASHIITVTNGPAPVTASFSANPSSGQAPLMVQFTDQSGGPVAWWNWNFGDGAASTAQNPSHTYNNAGSFTATLTVSGSSGQTSSGSHTITVTNGPAPVSASFSANPSSGQAPLTVQFTDQSSGPVSSWNWSFGDGATSTIQNPSHTYKGAGSFTATLTVGGSSGQTSSASQTITVTNAPPPPSTVTVVASQGLASNLSPGVFTITRSGDLSSSITVYYSLGGTAVNGVDYQTLSGSAVIAAGAATTTVEVQPIGFVVVMKTVVLTLSPVPAYTIGSPNCDTVTIVAVLGGGS